MIKEVIVVEGKDDIAAVKSAMDVEVISTNGFGYNKKFIKTLKSIAKRQGIIIFTDPDYMGEQIRRDLSNKIPNCKHAFLRQSKSIKDGDIGIENASNQDIIDAINKAKPKKEKSKVSYTNKDLLQNGLVGSSQSKEKRALLGEELGIGYSNGKQFLSRLNSFNISRDEFNEALERIE